MNSDKKELVKFTFMVLFLFLLLILTFMLGQQNQMMIENKIASFAEKNCPNLGFSSGFGGIVVGYYMNDSSSDVYNDFGSINFGGVGDGG